MISHNMLSVTCDRSCVNTDKYQMVIGLTTRPASNIHSPILLMVSVSNVKNVDSSVGPITG